MRARSLKDISEGSKVVFDGSILSVEKTAGKLFKAGGLYFLKRNGKCVSDSGKKAIYYDEATYKTQEESRRFQAEYLFIRDRFRKSPMTSGLTGEQLSQIVTIIKGGKNND